MLKLKIYGAENLKRWSHRSVLQPFAVAYLDKNKKFSTEKAQEGDSCYIWSETQSETLSIPLVEPIDDDTTLKVRMYDARNDDAKSKIGSASLKLRQVVINVGYGEVDRRTLQLKFITGRSHGDVFVEVSIEKPAIAEPGGQPPKKTKKFVDGVKHGLLVGAGLNKERIADGLRDMFETVKDGMADLF
ncbi:hypothetical protein SLE2022_402320 [Rubroshorea leprosula]